MHSYARKAAAAVLAADSMGRFWEYQDALYKNMNQLNDEKVREIAAGLGLDPAAFEKEMNSKRVRDLINRDMEDAEKAGVMGTPFIFINGRHLMDYSFEGFQDIIDTLLKKGE